MAVDLHTHSCCSDGSLTPSELMELAYEKKLAIALTDHDTVSGIKEAKKVQKICLLH
ncbi:MAG: PHP domain-containing protein [Lachnospiraceae bacterium]